MIITVTSALLVGIFVFTIFASLETLGFVCFIVLCLVMSGAVTFVNPKPVVMSGNATVEIVQGK